MYTSSESFSTLPKLTFTAASFSTLPGTTFILARNRFQPYQSSHSQKLEIVFNPSRYHIYTSWESFSALPGTTFILAFFLFHSSSILSFLSNYFSFLSKSFLQFFLIPFTFFLILSHFSLRFSSLCFSLHFLTFRIF